MTLRAPFPWFGGKSRAAHLVWAGFGDVANYVEPFAGSLAVLLGRPTEPRIETVNDLDCYLANFWRAVKYAPELVAEHADWPVNEADLHARHRWLVEQVDFRKRMRREPKYFDPLIAGWWVWGVCQWIGSGWCWVAEDRGRDQLKNGKHPDLHRGHGVHSRTTDWEGRTNAGRRSRGIQTAEKQWETRPDLSGSRGVHTALDGSFGGRVGNPLEQDRRPNLMGNGVHRRTRDLANSSNWEKRPSLGKGARGVQRELKQQIPMLSGDSGATGRGIHASAERNGALIDWMQALANRLRRVRVCCGDWKRVLGRSATERIGVTGVLLDPPYAAEADRDPSLYAHDSLNIAHEVREWALANGKNPRLRIALCGYEGEHDMPASWECVSWKAVGGYAASAGNTENAARERIWFSPNCNLVERQLGLFDAPPRRRRRSA